MRELPDTSIDGAGRACFARGTDMTLAMLLGLIWGGAGERNGCLPRLPEVADAHEQASFVRA
jgi:hypothetical protein